jgi:hypothetical protein
MLKKLVMLMCAVAVSGVTLGAQAKPAASTPAKATTKADQATPKPEPAAVKAAPAEQAMSLNIKIEVNITDQIGSGPAARKVVSMIVGDRQNTSIRSSASVLMKIPNGPGQPVSFTNRNVTINVDARPAIVYKEPTKIFVTFGLEYFPRPSGGAEEMEPGMASINERLGLILESGKPLIVSQAADPTSDRKITVEVTATILK